MSRRRDWDIIEFFWNSTVKQLSVCVLLEMSCVCFISFYWIGLSKVYFVFRKVEFLPVIVNQKVQRLCSSRTASSFTDVSFFSGTQSLRAVCVRLYSEYGALRCSSRFIITDTRSSRQTSVRSAVSGIFKLNEIFSKSWHHLFFFLHANLSYDVF